MGLPYSLLIIYSGKDYMSVINSIVYICMRYLSLKLGIWNFRQAAEDRPF
jgi:hypothetical protein